jgi:hypothetical protein
MGLDILDLVFRLERTFHVKIRREEFSQQFDKNSPPDINVGELFEFVRGKALSTDAFDEDLDAEVMWLMFRRDISDSMGVDVEEITKDRWIIRELGAL